MTTWTEDDFESLSWHDVHVHGFGIREGACGAGDVWFDLDWIVQWLCSAGDGGACRFRIARTALEFREATSLKISLDYAAPTAAVGPFSLDGIRRSEISHGPGHRSFLWSLKINWPTGLIEFDSPGFTQRLTGPVVETHQQRLTAAQRGEM